MNALPVPEGIRVHETSLGGRPALRISPDTAAGSGTLLYLHGGSHVAGSPRTALGLTAGLVVRTGIPGISLDYRLAPEHPFPADVQDVVAAYRELLEQGHAPESIAFAGDSAGGGLTITGALAARDAGLPMPAAIVAFSPGVDATRAGESMVTKAEADPLLDRASLDRLSSLYVAGQDRRNPLLSPAVTAGLTGLPPVLVQVGTNEMLLDDTRRLALRASDAEVDVVYRFRTRRRCCELVFGPMSWSRQGLNSTGFSSPRTTPTQGTRPPATATRGAVTSPSYTPCEVVCRAG
jgi:epsilon-lactone hydrolase